MTEGIIDATAEQVMSVIEQMVDLPWPDGDEWLEWEIEGLEGQTSYLMHVLPLAATSDAAALASWTATIAELADRRWGVRTVFEASRFTDDKHSASYDRRSAPASMVRALDSDHAVWWPHKDDAVLLVDNSAAAPTTSKAALLVLPRQWLSAGGADEVALQEPLVADFMSKDGSRVMHAVWQVFKTRDPQVFEPLVRALSAIDRATDDLELGGMLASNGGHLDHALDRIRLFSKRQCLCAAYVDHMFYEPAKEESYGHVRIVQVVPVLFNGRPDRPRRICECTDCGRRFEVEEGEYHYTWWKWTALGGGKHA